MKIEITPSQLRDQSLKCFLDEAYAKFNDGQERHGGILTDRDCFDEMKQEIIDQWHYWYAESIRKKAMLKYINDLEAEVASLRAMIQYGGHNGSACEGKATPSTTPG